MRRTQRFWLGGRSQPLARPPARAGDWSGWARRSDLFRIWLA